MTRGAASGAVVVLALALAGGAGAAPTLGGRLVPVPLVYERQPFVAITNLSTVPVIATITTGAGWTVAASTLPLAVGERRTVAITAAGPDDAPIVVTLTPAEAVPGMDRNSLALTTTARHLRPWEDVPDGPWWLILGLAALVASWAVLRRLRRPYRGLAR